MDEVVAVGDGDLCRWFATILARELPGPVVEAYRAGAAAPFLDALAARCTIDSERAALEAAIACWSAFADPTRQLATDFGSLFLLPGKGAALPYASFHAEQTLFGGAHDRMVERLQAAGFSLEASENGPADHIAVMLEYLAHLLESEGSNGAAAVFVRDELLPPAGAMSRSLARKTPASPFYLVISVLLTRYLHALVPSPTG